MALGGALLRVRAGLLLSLLFLNPNFIFAGSCKDFLLTRNINTPFIDYPLKGFWHLMKAGFYPIYLPGKIIYDRNKGRDLPDDDNRIRHHLLTRLKQDPLHMAAFLAFAFVVWESYVSFQEIDKHVEPESSGDLVVIVNGFSPNDPSNLYKYVEESSKRFAERHSNTVYIRPAQTKLEFIRQLINISEKYGKIKVLKLFGHGSSGSLALGSVNLESLTFALHDWERQNTRVEDFGYKSSVAIVEKRISKSTGQEIQIDRLDLRLKGVMAKDAKIGVYGCESARDQAGLDFLKYLGTVLADEGVTVYGSQLSVQKNLMEQMLLNWGANPDYVPLPVQQTFDYGMSGVTATANAFAKMFPEEKGKASSPFDFRLDRIQKVVVPPRN